MMTRLRRVAAGLAVAGLAAGGASLLSTGTAAAADVVVDDFLFIVDDADPAAGVVLHGYTGPGGAVQIPATIKFDGADRSVTTIGGAAFYSRSVTSVDIPDTVTTIGASAFRANGLTTVTLPAGLTEVSDGAFQENDLRSVVLPDAITTIGDYAFDQNSLTAVTFGPNVRSIGARAFRYNNLLAEVVFTGPAPALTARGDAGTFGPNDTVTVYYPWRFGAPTTAGGYASPTWANYPAEAEVTVSFEVGGTAPAPSAQQLRVGQAPVVPADPVRTGLLFGGWATSPTGEDDFDFAATPPADVIAHARWSPAPDAPEPSSGSMGSLGSLGSLFIS